MGRAPSQGRPSRHPHVQLASPFVAPSGSCAASVSWECWRARTWRARATRTRSELLRYAAPSGELLEVCHDLLPPILVDEDLDGLASGLSLHTAVLNEGVPLDGLHEEREPRALDGSILRVTPASGSRSFSVLRAIEAARQLRSRSTRAATRARRAGRARKAMLRDPEEIPMDSNGCIGMQNAG